MTPARYSSLVRELSTICRKVFDATPITVPWSDGAIKAEMQRQGSNNQFSVIQGCLDSLKRQGLVREPSPRHFQRIEQPTKQPEISMSRPENTTTTHRPAEPAPPPAPAVDLKLVKKKESALDRIARIAASLSSIVDELEDIAITVEEDLKAAGQDSEDLQQLRTLLDRVVKPRA